MKKDLLASIVLYLINLPALATENDTCIDCHSKVSPAQVADFKAS